MSKKNQNLPVVHSVGYLEIKTIAKDINALSYSKHPKMGQWLGSFEHQQQVREARERGEKTGFEQVAEHILDNFEEYFNYACNKKEPAVLIAIHHACIVGFIETFMFEGKNLLYTAQYKQADELIKKCLDTIELEISSYQRVLNSVIADDFLQELYLFREHVGNLIQEAKETKLVPYALQEKPAKRLSKNKISYKWQNAPDAELPELYHLLIANKLIQKDTTLDQFKTVFSEQPLGSFEPIKWHDDNATELLYFILQLEDTNNIVKGKQTNYQRLKRCFVKPDGTPFTENFRQAKQNLKSYGLAPVKQRIIDNIIQHFY